MSSRLLIRHTSGFGKRIEFWIIGQMLKQGLDVYVPLVDDMGIDAVIRRNDGSFTEVQIKARSKDISLEHAALFAAIPHELRVNYWFIFYSEQMDKMWIMTSKEFIAQSHQNKNGKNKGKRTIWFNGTRLDKQSKQRIAYVKPQYEEYVVTDFSRLLSETRRKSQGKKP